MMGSARACLRNLKKVFSSFIVLMVTANIICAFWTWFSDDADGSLQQQGDKLGSSSPSVPSTTLCERISSSLKYIIYNTRDQPYVPMPRFVNLRNVLNQHGWKEVTGLTENFTLMWTNHYPLFDGWETVVMNLSSHQFVSFIPGIREMSFKWVLSMKGLPYMPRSFDRRNIEELKEYRHLNPNATFLVKSKMHKGMRLVPSHLVESQTNFTTSFIQEVITNPFLYNGYVINIGVYTFIASMKPLRIYVYNDISLMFCQEKFYPFNGSDITKIDIHPHNEVWDLNFTNAMYPAHREKDILSGYLRSRGYDPRVLWNKIDTIAIDVVLKHQRSAITELKKFRKPQNFFVLHRLDFSLNDKLEPFLIEVNEPPGTEVTESYGRGQRHFFMQLHDAHLKFKGFINTETPTDYLEQYTDVFPELCYYNNSCALSCHEKHCSLCKGCLSESDRDLLRMAHREHLNAINRLRRVYPVPPTHAAAEELAQAHKAEGLPLTREDQMLHDWFKAKCAESTFWCQ